MKLLLPVAALVFAAGACCCCGDFGDDFDPASLGLPVTPEVTVAGSGGATGIIPGGHRIKVVSIQSDDAYYADRASIEGRDCLTAGDTTINEGFHGGAVSCGADSYYFYKATIEDLGVAPAAAGAVDGSRAKESVPSGARVKILDVASDDSYYTDRANIVGKLCTMQEASSFRDGEWHGGSINCDDGSSYYFYKAALERQ